MEFRTGLYNHQRAAVEKLSKIKVGALYMEQGTGKTRTALELAKIRMEKRRVDCVLWLCPCSVKKNLREDILYHCGEMPEKIVIRGIESLSSSDRLYMQLLRLVETHDVYLIVDESNLVKNKKAIRTGRIIELSKMCTYKMILNGTPVSRTEADMFAQWYILDWRILGYQSYYSFAANHLEFRCVKMPDGREVRTDQIVRVLNVDYLTEKIAPYTYQILKSDCLSLPKKHYRSRCFGMTCEQGIAYADVKQRYLFAVDEIKSETIYKMFTALQHVVSGRMVTSEPDERMRTEALFDSYIDNPRIQRLKEVIADDIGAEKCIIFAKYQSEIDDIGRLLDNMGLSWAMFTGRENQRKRQENREKFRGDTQFLLANKACGAYGLNLQFCRNIVYYSNDFDLATRMQSEDRVHRIGQEQEVYIYDIYAPDSIDQFIIDCLGRKENMVDAFKRGLWRDKEMGKVKYEIISAEKNVDFYARMGEFFASAKIRKELGGYAMSNEPEYPWIVAVIGGKIVGFIGLREKGKSYNIQAVYVLEEYRGKGIMNAMLDKAIQYCDSEITVTTKNELCKVYEERGFKATSEKSKNYMNMRREKDAEGVSR